LSRKGTISALEALRGALYKSTTSYYYYYYYYSSRTKIHGLGLEESIYFTQYCIRSRCACH